MSKYKKLDMSTEEKDQKLAEMETRYFFRFVVLVFIEYI